VPLPKNLRGKINGESDPPVRVTSEASNELATMARTGSRCLVCAHPNRAAIEEKIVEFKPPAIARWIVENGWPSISSDVVKKHFAVCIVSEVVRDKGAQRTAERFVARIEKLVGRMEGYLDEFDAQDSDDIGGVKAPKDWKGLSAIANQLRASLELLGKASGHLGPDNVINIIESPQFVTVATSIAQVTVQCPACGPAVKNILMDGSGNGTA